MLKDLSAWDLGASLYVPATRKDLQAVVLYNKYEGLRSLIVCLEDAVSDADLAEGLSNLRTLLIQLNECHQQRIESVKRPLIFIRPRNVEVAQWVIDNTQLDHVAGFVLPKFDSSCLEAWWQVIKTTDLLIMPTLETIDAHDVMKMQTLANTLAEHPCREKILALRIGGNDLMNGIRLRRSNRFTIYDGPLGYVIKMLAVTFASKGFYLTAPVFEHIENHALFEKELELDVIHGLVGKTIIHPSQLTAVEEKFSVSTHEYSEAMEILNSTEAVFKFNGSMCEPTTQYRWAKDIMARVNSCKKKSFV